MSHGVGSKKGSKNHLYWYAMRKADIISFVSMGHF